jgi:hypothetical protein
MNEHVSPTPVTRYAPEHRARALEFLRLIDDKFLPPLSSPLRYGSLEGYLDYSLADGRGRVLVYERGPHIIGFLAYRYEQGAELRPGELIYLSNMCVSESLMGTVLLHLYHAMIRQVEKDGLGPPQRIWAKTWRENRASAKTLARVGLQHVQTIPNDPAFQGCRDTLIFEGPWADFVRNVQDLFRSA